MSAETASEPVAPAPVATRNIWPLERILFALAGTMTGLSALLSAFVSPWFLLLTGFVAFNQLLFVSLGDCPASLILRHVFGAQRSWSR